LLAKSNDDRTSNHSWRRVRRRAVKTTNVSDLIHPNRTGSETQAGYWIRVPCFLESRLMGKGDRRSKRGKIFRGTYGKKRPKPQEERKKAKAAAAQS
jgi:30S ribosomal protein S31